MTRYLISRVAQSFAVLLLLSIVVFFIARLSGSPVSIMLPEGASAEQRQALIERLALDRPIWEQYFTFISQAVTGDFGRSTRFHMDALELVLSRLPNTFILALSAILIAVVIGVPLGIRAGLKSGAWDNAISTITATLQAIPSFWLAILLILVVGVMMQALPFYGFQTWSSLILPAVSLSILPLVTVIRVTRSSVRGVMPQHYIESARAKGLSELTVIRRHVLRNAFIPVITVLGLMLGAALSGAVITEQIFAWPGVGSLAIEAIKARDYPVVQCIALIAGAIIIFVNLLVDLSYRFIDPRTRTGGRA